MIRVLIAEDSITCLGLLTEILATDPALELIGHASDGAQAIKLNRELRPDVIVMDIHMPLVDGFEATRQIMIEAPTPIVIVSATVNVRQVAVSMHALRAGALALMPKPTLGDPLDFVEQARRFTASIRAMAAVRVVRRWETKVSLPPSASLKPGNGSEATVIAIAASTGGPAALYRVLSELPARLPVPVLIVQHIASGFVEGLAAWLNDATPLQVKVASAREVLQNGYVYIAPDDHHLGLRDAQTLELSRAPAIGGFRPSGSYLFDSVARTHGSGAIAVVLTGMGEDGLTGLRAVRAAGGRIVAQDEATSVVFGMPGAAVAAGLPDAILPLDMIAPRLSRLFTQTMGTGAETGTATGTGNGVAS
jgi:two-component system chemotaxis response regulator CheB